MASGIVNGAAETMGTAKYSLGLFQRIVAVSLRTEEIVKNLPGRIYSNERRFVIMFDLLYFLPAQVQRACVAGER